MKTKTKLRNKGYIRDKNNFNEGVKLWASYYRANVGRFAIDYLQLPLFPFQMMLIHVMNINNFFYFVGSRGLGKSYLTAIYCCCRAILYPNSKIVVVSGTKGQAKLLISQKIEKELMMMSPNLKREIASVQVGQNVALVKFKNGSTIEAVSGTDNSRGTRCNVLVVDESRLINKDVLSKVVRPFLTVIRQPKFLSKPEYKNYPREENSELYLTSAWYKDHYVYDRFKSFAKGMMNNKPYFACAFPYQLAVEHGLLTQSRVNAIRNEDDMDEIAWIMEMCSIFYGEKSNAFYKSSDINPCRNIYKPWIPPTDLEYLEEKEKSKKKYHLKKQGGEIRIIGCDISVMGGAKNDASVFTLMRLIPQGGEYIRHVVYIESLEGGNAADQAKRIKQLFYDFQADYVALDAQGGYTPLMVEISYSKLG